MITVCPQCGGTSLDRDEEPLWDMQQSKFVYRVVYRCTDCGLSMRARQEENGNSD